MDVLHPRCCGLDVHKSSISACILLREAGRVQKHQRRFGAMTQELQELAELLRQVGVSQVAMESSGVYWKPVWNILEGQFTPLRWHTREWCLSVSSSFKQECTPQQLRLAYLHRAERVSARALVSISRPLEISHLA